MNVLYIFGNLSSMNEFITFTIWVPTVITKRLKAKINFCREISIQGEGALLLVQLSNNFLISCFKKHNF